jgi:hypothetical protein
LGAELAAARKSEEERLAAGVIDPSPLPETGYDFERGDYDLVKVAPLQLDLNLRDFTDEVQRMDLNQQNRTQRSLSLDDLYTLIHFVKRSSVLALNDAQMDWFRAGLTALAIIDEKRVDWRDVRWAAGLLEYAIYKTEDAKEKLAEFAVDLPRPALEFLNHLAGRSKLSDWGYSEINTTNGLGFIQTDSAEFKPSVDLTGIALFASEKLSNGRYVAHVEIATDVPEIWFNKNKQLEVRSRLNQALGAVAVKGSLRSEYDDSGNQMFVEWIVEMATADDSVFLCDAVGPGTPLSERYAVGVSEGKLFAILVAGSIRDGVKSFENLASLTELGEQTAQILRSELRSS